jgi:hypothetical protein
MTGASFPQDTPRAERGPPGPDAPLAAAVHGARVDTGRRSSTFATAANSAGDHSGIGQRPARADHSRRAFRSATIVTPVRRVSERETVSTGPLTVCRNSGGCFPVRYFVV